MAADASAAPALSPVATDKAPAAIGPYSQAMCAGDTVYVSGCIGMVPGDSKAFAGDGVAEQAAQALANMAAILDAAGSSMQHVAKTTVLLTDMEHYAEVNKVYAEAFGEHKPARAAFAVKGLPAGALVEIDAVAVKK